jgi:hypothetical protein
MALLLLAQRATLLRLAFASNASGVAGEDNDVVGSRESTARDERRGLAAVTLALAVRAHSTEDFAKAIRCCDTVISVSRGDSDGHNKAPVAAAAAAGVDGETSGAETEEALATNILSVRADALLLRSQIFERFHIWAQATADAKQVLDMGSSASSDGGIGLSKWRVARDRVKHLEKQSQHHLRQAGQQNLKAARRQAARERDEAALQVKEARVAAAASAQAIRAERALKRKIKKEQASMVESVVGDGGEKYGVVSDEMRKQVAEEKQARLRERKERKKELQRREQNKVQKRLVKELARQQRLKDEWEAVSEQEAKTVKAHAQNVLYMRQKLSIQQEEETKRLAAAAAVARPNSETTTFRPESGVPKDKPNALDQQQPGGHSAEEVSSHNANAVSSAALDAARRLACSDEPMSAAAAASHASSPPEPPSAPRPRVGEWAAVVAPTTTTAPTAAGVAAAEMYRRALNPTWHIKGPINFWGDPQPLSGAEEGVVDDDGINSEESECDEDEDEDEYLDSGDEVSESGDDRRSDSGDSQQQQQHMAEAECDMSVGTTGHVTGNEHGLIDSNEKQRVVQTAALSLHSSNISDSHSNLGPDILNTNTNTASSRLATSTSTSALSSPSSSKGVQKVQKVAPPQIIIDGANVGYYFGAQFSASVSKKRNFGAQGLEAALEHFNGTSGTGRSNVTLGMTLMNAFVL